MKDVGKGMKNMAQEIDALFTPMLNAMHDFIEKDEKEIGCLSDNEHKTTIKIVNWFARLYDTKREREDEPIQHKPKQVPPNILYSDIVGMNIEMDMKHSRNIQMEV